MRDHTLGWWNNHFGVMGAFSLSKGIIIGFQPGEATYPVARPLL